MRSHRGFTLIESMIVVAIIGILAAIVIPAYQTYIIRAQLSEGSNLLDPARIGITEFYAQHGNFPPDNGAISLPVSSAIYGNYVSSLGACRAWARKAKKGGVDAMWRRICRLIAEAMGQKDAAAGRRTALLQPAILKPDRLLAVSNPNSGVLVTVTYGGAKANTAIQNKTLYLSVRAGANSILWTCTNAPGGTTPATAVPAQYLPASCR